MNAVEKKTNKKAQERELFLLFNEFKKTIDNLEEFFFKKAKNSKEFKEFISKLEEDKQPKLFTPEELKIV
ncbi:hypothetical protein L8X52_07650 [Campylobacter lari]|uniref:hypothetical protein n=1 Tax=Campylobacter lari TaxID=201 RepID=UPI001280B8BF|nr:hypothetical protein [Campylobacter lari]MBT0826751.1 hypothetical protein [Campylobacter lari]MBT0832035.1 hypothetical protein [Campylobacter lari]MCV3501492.1 hypothetical protein [Campylobacter lari]